MNDIYRAKNCVMFKANLIENRLVFLCLLLTLILPTLAKAEFFPFKRVNFEANQPIVETRCIRSEFVEAGKARPVRVNDEFLKFSQTTVIVDEVLGASERCKDLPFGTMAKVKSYKVEPIYARPHAGVDMPDGYSVMQDQFQEIGKPKYLTLRNKILDAFVGFEFIERTGPDVASTLIGNVKEFRRKQLYNFNNSPVEELTINGLRAWRFEVTGRAKFLGSDLSIVNTLIEGGSEYVLVFAWTTTSKYKDLKDDLYSVAQRVVGISRTSENPFGTIEPSPEIISVAANKVMKATSDGNDATVNEVNNIVSGKNALQGTEGVNSKINNSNALSLGCLAKISDRPSAKLLHGKFSIQTRSKLSLAQLSDPTKANSLEKGALSDLVSEWESCLEIAEDWRKQNYPSSINGLYSVYWVDLKTIYADLYSGKLSFGEALRLRLKLETDFNNKLDALIGEIQEKAASEERRLREVESERRLAEARTQQQREAERERQRLADKQLELQDAQLAEMRRQQRDAANSAMLANGLLLLQAGQPKFRPSITCNTDRFGNGLQTNCN